MPAVHYPPHSSIHSIIQLSIHPQSSTPKLTPPSALRTHPLHHPQRSPTLPSRRTRARDRNSPFPIRISHFPSPAQRRTTDRAFPTSLRTSRIFRLNVQPDIQSQQIKSQKELGIGFKQNEQESLWGWRRE